MTSDGPGRPNRQKETMAAAGVLSSGVASELLRPLRDLRERLAELVQRLDRYAIEARGPMPYPYNDTKLMREELAEAYLLCRRVTRLAGDLSSAVDHRASSAEAVDVNRVVESAINLARHQISSDTEVFIDHGSVPPVRVVAAELMLGVSQLLIIAAESARKLSGTAISVKTLRESDPERGVDDVVIYVADNGGGCPEELEAARVLIEPLVSPIGGFFEGTSENGSGSVFEVRLPIGR